jgi:DNA-directed RNA polymerase subunit K/omega
MVEYWNNRLTKFELTRILGARTLQIALGAPVFIKTKGEEYALEIAKKELFAAKVPVVILRTYPNKETERVDIHNPKIIESMKKFF